MLRRTVALAIAGALVTSSAAAYAASGSISDPQGDYPDVVRLAYVNATTKVTMTMTLAGGHAQNESFYLRWGAKGASYQVFSSPSIDLTELRYYSRATAEPKRIGCAGLIVKHSSSNVTAVTVPRRCIAKAPDTLRFQGIATEGTSLLDETRITKAVSRG